MAQITRTALQNILREHICMIVFIKVNRQRRAMLCTLRPEFLPPLKGTGKFYFWTLPVWSIADKGWRSFRMENILSVEILK